MIPYLDPITPLRINEGTSDELLDALERANGVYDDRGADKRGDADGFFGKARAQRPAVSPPSIGKATPVTKRASNEAR